MDEQNFVEENSPFSERAKEAALRGNLNCALPLLGTLEDTHAALCGLAWFCKIAKANRVQEIAWRDKDDESIQPPMEINTVESLLALGEGLVATFPKDSISDRLHMRAAQLDSLMTTMIGDDHFSMLGDQVQSDLLWLAGSLSTEIQKLLDAQLSERIERTDE